MAHSQLETCPQCGRQVPCLYPLDDAYFSAAESALIGTPAPVTHHVCFACLCRAVGASESAIIAENRYASRNTEFTLNVMKGRVGQAIVESVFTEFGYEVYPFGYETYFTNIIRHMQRGIANEAVRKTRATPDLFLYDREVNEGHFIEIKTTTSPDESVVWVPKSQIQLYLRHWPEASIVFCCLRTINLYCEDIANVAWDDLPRDYPPDGRQECYVVDLRNTLLPLTRRFRLLEHERYQLLLDSIRRICGLIGS